MVIKVQKGNVIVNFDTVSTIERNGHKINCYFKDSPCPLLLGDYPTDVRAQEVLNEFFNYYSITLINDVRGQAYHEIFNYHQVYEMPKE